MDRGFGYREGSRGQAARKGDQHGGLGRGNMDYGFLESLLGFLDSSLWYQIFLWDILCMNKSQEGGLPPRKLDRGWDGQTSFLLLRIHTFRGQERKLLMTLPLASAPLGCPLLSFTAPSPHSKVLPVGTIILLYHWDCSYLFSDITTKGICISGAEWRRGRARRQEWVVNDQVRCYPRNPKGQAGQVEMLQALPSLLCYPVKCED